MKKSLLALAVLGAFTGMASAQSSVTMFGVVDLSARNTTNGNNSSQKTMGSDGVASSRWGVRGTEDLGGGLLAGFFLDHRFDPGPGTQNPKFWHGRSTVSLIGRFGEVRLGRDLNPTFTSWASYDPFGTNGVGALTNISSVLGSGAATNVRTDNAAQYILPALGGFYGTAMVAPGEGVAGNKYTGGRLGFGAGPVDVSVGVSKTENGAAGVADFERRSVGGSVKFGPAKVSALVMDSEFGVIEQRMSQLGVVVTLGQGEIRAALSKSDMKGGAAGTAFTNASDSTMYALGYLYSLSARTGLYASYANIKNKGAANFLVPGGIGGAVGLTSKGYEAGLRHAF